MVEILLPVVIGGLIAILGGVWQSHMSLKNEIKREHRAKRETAYLELIDALLRIEVDDCVLTNSFLFSCKLRFCPSSAPNC